MAIKKKDFNSIKKKFSTSAKYKPQRFLDLGEDFLDAVGLPGPAIGHLNMFLGHSDTGKTTALVKAAVDAQKKGILPVFIITEQKWSFEHAKLMGFECEEMVDEDGIFAEPVVREHIDYDKEEKVTSIALDEFLDGKIDWKKSDDPIDK